MKTWIIRLSLLTVMALSAVIAVGQHEGTGTADSVSVHQLPEYIVIQSEVTGRMIGKQSIRIGANDPSYKAAVKQLENELTGRKNLNIRHQTDLYNAMSRFGFEFVGAYPIGGADFVHIVFRKKPGFRN